MSQRAPCRAECVVFYRVHIAVTFSSTACGTASILSYVLPHGSRFGERAVVKRAVHGICSFSSHNFYKYYFWGAQEMYPVWVAAYAARSGSFY